VRHTSPSRIGAIRVAFPRTVEVQRAVARQLAALGEETERLEDIYQQKLDALDELKGALLHHAFSGEL
jgi:type I restriction enzyme S subunit